MAPEQARSDDVDHRADMYSLGACFYHLLCGKPVFDGQTPLSVVAKHLTSTVEPLRERAPRVPRALAIVIERLLAKDPAERFDTYDALIAALEAAAPDRAPYAGFWTRSAAVVLDSGLAGGLIALIGWPGLVVHLAHVTLGHAYRGQTLAKYFLRIQVRRLDGSRLGLPRSFVRTLASLWLELVVGVMILLTEGRGELVATIEQLQPAQVTHVQNLIVAIAISNGVLSLLYAAGLVLAAFHPQKRALHDLLVGSVVTYRLGRA